MAALSPPERQIPPLRFPADLPVAQRRQEIMDAIRAHPVVVVAGETGSGKTTQLPKICLELGRGRHARIGHTQPRRLAARTVAQRIAAELDTALGEVVGYQVRFTDQVSQASAVKLMTDGILLAEIQRDRLLRQYDTLIIDEAHERSLNIDFLLGYLKNILPRRPDLKLIITSATIDLESFSRHFDNAPIIEVSGRTYPVETLYIDPAGAGEQQQDRDLGLQAQVVQLVQDIAAGRFGERGDILVFLPGERDIRELAKLLRGDAGLDVLPLYARLSQGEQQRVFDLSRRKGVRVVLATNVAETSVTVPGIRYVIDPGEARISRYSYRTKVQRLPIEPISQASANQRQGRCGRVMAGVCIRLYSEEDFQRRPPFTDPEIRRTNLAAVILQMLDLGLGELERFPFIDPPDARMVRDGYKLLEELGAVNAAGKLTPVGRQMSRLPLDPRLARMILAAAQQHCLAQVLVIASALSIQDPRERPADKQQPSDQSHARFRHEKSDFMAWLTLWRYYEEQRQALSQNQLRKLCQKEFLSFLRLREWRDIHYQLTLACRQQGLRPARELPVEENYGQVHKALLAGLLGNIAQYQEGREYLGARNRKLQIFPGSSQARKRPKWLVAAEIVETSSVFAR
ncbi:MAG: ATP-dependent RNA helicase HrpA, partial [Parahaliea sp.]